LINVLGATRATGAPLDGGDVVFEDYCGVRLLNVEIKQDSTMPNYNLGTTRRSHIFYLCGGQSDSALLLARLVDKIIADNVQCARCRFAVDVAASVGVQVLNECQISGTAEHNTIIMRPRNVAH
jgi:hypothetical protein